MRLSSKNTQTHIECHTQDHTLEDAFIASNDNGGFDVHAVATNIVAVYDPFPSDMRIENAAQRSVSLSPQ